MANLAKLTKAQLIAQIEDLRHEFLTLQVESQDTIEDLRTKYSDLSIGYDQLLHDISVLEMEVKDAEAAAQSASSKAPSTSRQDHSAQRFEIMQKAKAQAMASGRSVKC